MRVTADDESVRMPPEGPPLTAAQIELLKQWIGEGANWPPHWAYRPLKKPVPPAMANAEQQTWARGAIDRFVLAKLDERKLSPSPPADSARCCGESTSTSSACRRRRPSSTRSSPTTRPTPTSDVVDRLLASPRYGERWARHWMDVVHFAETHGHDQDRPRDNAWPYRDYLIRSFNDDKPYARFVAGADRRRRAVSRRPAGDRRHRLPRRRAVGREFAARHSRRHARPRDRPLSRPRRHGHARSCRRSPAAPSTVPAATITSSTRSRRRTTTPCRRCSPATTRRTARSTPIRRSPRGDELELTKSTRRAWRAGSVSCSTAACNRRTCGELAAWENDSLPPTAAGRCCRASKASHRRAARELAQLDDGSMLAAGIGPRRTTYTVIAQCSRPQRFPACGWKC